MDKLLEHIQVERYFVKNLSSKSCDEVPMDMFPGWAKRMAEMQIQSYKKQHSNQKLFYRKTMQCIWTWRQL